MMTKKAYKLYNELNKIEERLLLIRSRLVRDEIMAEQAAIKSRAVAIDLTEVALSVFRDTPKNR